MKELLRLQHVWKTIYNFFIIILFTLPSYQFPRFFFCYSHCPPRTGGFPNTNSQNRFLFPKHSHHTCTRDDSSLLVLGKIVQCVRVTRSGANLAINPPQYERVLPSPGGSRLRIEETNQSINVDVNLAINPKSISFS